MAVQRTAIIVNANLFSDKNMKLLCSLPSEKKKLKKGLNLLKRTKNLFQRLTALCIPSIKPWSVNKWFYTCFETVSVFFCYIFYCWRQKFNTSLFIQIEQVCKASALNKLNKTYHKHCKIFTIKASTGARFSFFSSFIINHIYRSHYCFTTLLTPLATELCAKTKKSW